MIAQEDYSVHAKEPATPISPDTCRKLYDLAAKVRALEPWLWMEETDIFGVKDTESEDILFVSVMGLLGEYHAIAVYPGVNALAQFWQMQNIPDGESVTDILPTIRYVHAAFGKKGELQPEEKRLLASLGLEFKGSKSWPRLLSFRPGWYPWLVDAQEARWLALALEQLLEVAPRLQLDRRLLGKGGTEHRYLIRVPSGTNTQTPWKDAHMPSSALPNSLRITVPNSLIDAVLAMPSTGVTIELDVAPFFTPIGKKGERPQLPYMMLAVEPESDFIVGVEMLTVEGSVEELWAQIPAKFLEMVRRNQMRPACIALRVSWLFMLMQGLCKDLGIEIKPDPELKALTRARRSLERFNSR